MPFLLCDSGCVSPPSNLGHHSPIINSTLDTYPLSKHARLAKHKHLYTPSTPQYVLSRLAPLACNVSIYVCIIPLVK